MRALGICRARVCPKYAVTLRTQMLTLPLPFGRLSDIVNIACRDCLAAPSPVSRG